MVPFDFEPRTRVVFGRGAVQRVGQLARGLDFHRVFLVADGGLVKAGHVGIVTAALESEGIQVLPYHDFGENPDTTMIDDGVRFAESLRPDSVVALGGGSSLDCAKGINFVLTNGGSMHEYRGYGKARTPLLPMIGIPTTAGTGSEAQSYAVISDAATHMKMACGDPSAAVRIALLDPELTLTAPRHVTAMAGFDAIAHAVETAVTIRRTPMSDTFSHRAWHLLNDAFERVLLYPADGEARAAMQLGAHYAGMAIEQSMLGAAHACANPLTARYGTTHGIAIAVMLPHVVRWNAEAVGDRYAELLRVSGADAGGDAGGALAAKLDGLACAAGLPRTLQELGVERGAFAGLAADAATQWTGANNPRPFDAAAAGALYEAAFE